MVIETWNYSLLWIHNEINIIKKYWKNFSSYIIKSNNFF